METVPKDVIDSANKLENLFGDGKQGYTAFDIAVFAIMDERSRCKQLCDGLDVQLKIYPSEAAKSYYLEGVTDASAAISKAIDAPGTRLVEFGLEKTNGNQ